MKALQNRFKFKTQNGFSMIELLVVMIIISILSMIAMSVYVRQREKAWDAAVKSDLHNAAIAQSTYGMDMGIYTSKLGDLDDRGFHTTSGVTVTIDPGAAENYCMEGFHSGNPGIVWHVRSEEGEPIPNPGPCL